MSPPPMTPTERIQWIKERRWYWAAAGFAVYQLVSRWLSGDLSTVSFWILGVTGAFELAILFYVLRGVNWWRNNEERLDQERRRDELWAKSRRKGMR